MIVITGDFNHDLLKYGNDNKVTKFLNFMLEQHFHPCITEPTRFVDINNPSLVDNIFTRNIPDPISGNILEKISYDHLPNFLQFRAVKPPMKTKNIKTRDTQNFNINNYLYDLNKLDLHNHIHKPTNEMTKLLHDNCLNAYNKQWLTSGILKSIRVKRSLFKLYKNTLNIEY